MENPKIEHSLYSAFQHLGWAMSSTFDVVGDKIKVNPPDYETILKKQMWENAKKQAQDVTEINYNTATAYQSNFYELLPTQMSLPKK